MLKPIKLLDFDDGQVFLPYDDCSTSDEDYWRLWVILESCCVTLDKYEKPW